MLPVYKAIRNGKRVLVYVPMTIFLSLMLGGAFLCAYFNAPWPFLVGFPLGFVLAWLYWALRVTSWKIWAFGHVRNVHELKMKAIRYKILHPDDSFFGRLAFQTASQRAALLDLEAKFQQQDILQDDASVPPETQINYSRKSTILALFLGILAVAAGDYILLHNHKNPWGYMAGSFVLAVVFLNIAWKQLAQRKPKMILNASGIQLYNHPFVGWASVDRVTIVKRQNGNQHHYWLDIVTDHGRLNRELTNLSCSPDVLDHLLQVYRARHLHA